MAKRVITLFVLSGVLACVIWYKWMYRVATPIPSVGGDMKFATLLMDSPIYLQNDKRWRKETIGGSDERIGSVGCVICCIAMSLTYYGMDVDPVAVNTHLKQVNGYTSQGRVIWKAVVDFSDELRVDIPRTPTHRKIDKALKEGNPIIAKILLNGFIPHWVLIVGKRTGGKYLVLDPLGDGKTVDILSHFNSDIYAIRVIYRDEEA